jgi:CRISPR-associated protein Cse2 (CRISPR_cse2)
MNNQNTQSAVAEKERRERPGARLDVLANMLRGLQAAKATGELASLRRMDRSGTPPQAFFRLVARAGFTEMTDGVSRWAAAVHVMAQRPDALRTDIRLGEALLRIGLSEQRLDMLLNARGNTLFDLVRRLSLRLARSEEGIPYRELCQLVIWADRPEREAQAERLRLDIAQSYQRAVHHRQPGGDAA